jgi:hypothetical protein
MPADKTTAAEPESVTEEPTVAEPIPDFPAPPATTPPPSTVQTMESENAKPNGPDIFLGPGMTITTYGKDPE